jgi:MFS transporter, DHA2 family, multidrug resistance protein
MAGFLGALEYVLEDGPRYDWFDDDTILTFAWVSAISAVAFFARVLTAQQPIVDLRSYSSRNFALGSLFSFVLGIGLYGLTVVYPLYLGRVRGYDALMIGETMFVSGLAMFLTAPIAGRLVVKLDQRMMLMFGFFCFAIGTWWMIYLTKDWDFWELWWPQIFRGIGLMFAIIPINNIALSTLPPDRVKNASGLYNLMRNLGGAVGLAAIYTFLNDRTDLHLARLHEALNSAYRPALEALDNLTLRFQGYGADAKMMALKQLFMMAHREGVVMAFSDVFLALTVLFAAVGLGTIMMKRPPSAAAPSGEH